MIVPFVFAAALSAAPLRLTVAGDSLALGIGASDSSHGFAFDLFRRIEARRPGSVVTDLAVGGATAADVDRLESPRVRATRPDLVLLEAGANDAVRRRTAAAFARDYARLVAHVAAASPGATLVLFNVPDVSVSPIFETGAKPALHRLVAAYNVAVAAQARRRRLRVVDLYAVSQAARSDAARWFGADLFHPSDDGHARIAAAAWPVVRDAIASR